MRYFIPLLAALMVIAPSLGSGSELRLLSIRIPLYFHGDTDPEIVICEVPIASFHAYPETLISGMNGSFVPHHADGSWNRPGDANLLSLYGIQLRPVIRGKGDYEILINISAAEQPDGMPFSIDEVVTVAKTAASLNSPSGEGWRHTFRIVTEAPEDAEG